MCASLGINVGGRGRIYATREELKDGGDEKKRHTRVGRAALPQEFAFSCRASYQVDVAGRLPLNPVTKLAFSGQSLAEERGGPLGLTGALRIEGPHSFTKLPFRRKSGVPAWICAS